MFEIYKISTDKVIANGFTTKQAAWRFRMFQPDMIDLVIRLMN